MFWGQEGGPVSPLPLPLPCPPSSFLLGHTPGVGSATSSRVGTPAAPLQRTCLEASIASPFCWGLVLTPWDAGSSRRLYTLVWDPDRKRLFKIGDK